LALDAKAASRCGAAEAGVSQGAEVLVPQQPTFAPDRGSTT
jgi:hypothetical protein